MPSILFRSERSPARPATGEFHCPQCVALRPYRRAVVRRSLGLGSIKVPFGKAGESIECEACLCTFRPEVLAFRGDSTRAVLPEYQRTMKRLLALMVVVDGRVREPEIKIVRDIFKSLTGIALSRADVLEEAEAVHRTPMTAARYLAGVVGYLNDYGKEQVLRAAALVSHSDGFLHFRESDMVHRLAGVMKIDAARVDEILEELA